MVAEVLWNYFLFNGLPNNFYAGIFQKTPVALLCTTKSCQALVGLSLFGDWLIFLLSSGRGANRTTGQIVSEFSQAVNIQLQSMHIIIKCACPWKFGFCT
jgi:hypothetical protein